MIRFCGNVLRTPTLHLLRGISSAGGSLGFRANGMWRSLVARTAGGREVASSSLVIPTKKL